MSSIKAAEPKHVDLAVNRLNRVRGLADVPRYILSEFKQVEKEQVEEVEEEERRRMSYLTMR